MSKYKLGTQYEVFHGFKNRGKAQVSKPWRAEGMVPNWLRKWYGCQLSQTAKPKDYIYSVAWVVWMWALDVKLNNNEIITQTSYPKLTIKPHKLHYKCNL